MMNLNQEPIPLEAGFTASFHFSNNICYVRIIDVGVVISSYYHLMGGQGGHSFIRIRELMIVM